jgi:hypothetical protein
MGKHGKEFVLNAFDPDRLTNQIEEVYRSLTGQPTIARAA